MQTPEAVAAMLRLHQLGWGTQRIARELDCSPHTVRHTLRHGGWRPGRRPVRRRVLGGPEDWLAASFRQHRGNADVGRQEWQRGHGLDVSLRTVERAVRPWRQRLEAEARATVRFETPPGQPLPIDLGTTTGLIGTERVVIRLFVATLGYSRRALVAAFDHERQAAWFAGLERTFRYLGGVPEEVLVDNARTLVDAHDRATRVVAFNARFLAFARYWGFPPRAGAPYRARTKGQDERGVGYVKRNALAGRTFASGAALEAHLSPWLRTVADVREHGTTGEPPLERFQRAEAAALRPLNGRPPFHWTRELTRPVHADGCVEVDTNPYSVPWRRIGEAVTVRIVDAHRRVTRAGSEVAQPVVRAGRRQWVIDPAHLAGVVGAPVRVGVSTEAGPVAPAPALLRPWAASEAIAGGGW